MRHVFESQLKDLHVSLIQMSSFVEGSINTVIKALKKQDSTLADKVIKDDEDIDRLELEIEEACFRLLALQQPMAKDLRRIGTIFKIITDLERMGDYCVNIAKIVKEVGQKEYFKPLIDIPKMAELTQQMVKGSIDSYVNEDTSLAREVAKADQEVDDLYEKIYMEIIERMTEDKDIIFQGTRLLFVGRHLERIADHATNICERVVYMVEGELVSLE